MTLFKTYFEKEMVNFLSKKYKNKEKWKKCKNQNLKDIICYHNNDKTKTKKVLNGIFSGKNYSNSYIIWNVVCDCPKSHESFIKEMYNNYSLFLN